MVEGQTAAYGRPQTQGVPGHKKLAMVLLAFASNNAGYGLVLGSYAAIMTKLDDLPGASLTLASSGIALLLLSMGLLSPLVGNLVQRFPLRLIMPMGATLCAAGFGLLSFATNIFVILGTYLVILGPGVALMGTIPASALIGTWVTERRGLAMGFVNMPIVMSFTAPIAAALVDKGLQIAFISLAVAYAAMIPLLLLVRNSPQQTGKIEQPLPPAPTSSARQILTTPSFWMIVPTAGAIAGAGVMLTTHVVALGLERGLDVSTAALLLSAYGLAGIPGSFIFGALADRFGGAVALLCIAVWQALCWGLLAFVGLEGWQLVVIFAAIGLAAGGLMGPFLSAITSRFGTGAKMTTVVGLSGAVNTVFIFGLAPLAGLLHGIANSYVIPLALHICIFLMCAALFFVESKRPAPLARI